eukprot:gnl/MRDRNA2_/MRDRNA2_298780_c0_seq1.p1 gnl/MRDRNA2_/MRDRNA2_298780_c0~~gnl/MRDRNA2_/MRDRNA2_298780_c0_seq1.p1  ORF type:complete len:386 (+),score=78.56 gnl/MRDRNA2_/MRDRNA2_298780_c0_seq1:55-1158(+)
MALDDLQCIDDRASFCSEASAASDWRSISGTNHDDTTEGLQENFSGTSMAQDVQADVGDHLQLHPSNTDDSAALESVDHNLVSEDWHSEECSNAGINLQDKEVSTFIDVPLTPTPRSNDDVQEICSEPDSTDITKQYDVDWSKMSEETEDFTCTLSQAKNMGYTQKFCCSSSSGSSTPSKVAFSNLHEDDHDFEPGSFGYHLDQSSTWHDETAPNGMPSDASSTIGATAAGFLFRSLDRLLGGHPHFQEAAELSAPRENLRASDGQELMPVEASASLTSANVSADVGKVVGEWRHSRSLPEHIRVIEKGDSLVFDHPLLGSSSILKEEFFDGPNLYRYKGHTGTQQGNEIIWSNSAKWFRVPAADDV